MPKNKPSLTARKVASDFLFKVEDPEVAPFAPAGSISTTYDLLSAANLLKPWMVSLIKAPWYQRFGRAIEKPILPGQMLHLVLRKRFFDDEVRAAIAAGVNQVLVVGAGYDTLCPRLAAEYLEVTFLEVDHPPTHRVKAEAVKATGASRSNLHLQGVDLAERSLESVLRESPVWSVDSRSVVVAEGVLMYLAEEDVVAFFSAVRSSSAVESRVLASYIYDEAMRGKTLGWLGVVLTATLRLFGEPFRWGVDEDGIEPVVAARGFRVVGDSTRFDLKARYLKPAGKGDWVVARLERVVAAESADFSET